MTAMFECVTQIEAPMDRVFDAALNIDAHVDSMARFGERAVAGVTAGQIGLGEQVTWRARHLGIRWTMTSRIVELERPTSFVDEQTRGPFARFRHQHRFVDKEGDTEMTDVVSFEAPFGPLGLLAERILHPYLRGLIERRNLYLKEAAERPR